MTMGKGLFNNINYETQMCNGILKQLIKPYLTFQFNFTKNFNTASNNFLLRLLPQNM